MTKNYISSVKKDEGGEGRWHRKTHLAAVRVGARVGLFGVSLLIAARYCHGTTHHRQKPWTGMFHLKILILKEENEFERLERIRG